MATNDKDKLRELTRKQLELERALLKKKREIEQTKKRK